MKEGGSCPWNSSWRVLKAFARQVRFLATKKQQQDASRFQLGSKVNLTAVGYASN